MKRLYKKLLKIFWTEEDDLEKDFFRLYCIYAIGTVAVIYLIALFIR